MYSALSLGFILLFLGYACQPAIPGVAAPMQTGDEGTTALELPIPGLIDKGDAAHRARACGCVPANGVSVWIELFGSNKKRGRSSAFQDVRNVRSGRSALRQSRDAHWPACWENGRASSWLIGVEAVSVRWSAAATQPTGEAGQAKARAEEDGRSGFRHRFDD
jgi:hypothetical protein